MTSSEPNPYEPPEADAGPPATGARARIVAVVGALACLPLVYFAYLYGWSYRTNLQLDVGLGLGLGLAAAGVPSTLLFLISGARPEILRWRALRGYLAVASIGGIVAVAVVLVVMWRGGHPFYMLLPTELWPIDS